MPHRLSLVTAPSILDTEELRHRVSQALDAFVTARGELVTSISVDLHPLIDAITELLAGGKRLRPAFCYWGARGAGLPSSDGLVEAAAALELLQACALIHDDVMDGSATRRGLPAAHHRFANLHRLEQWHGSPEDFGVGAAILLGDLCLSWADEMLLASSLDASALARAKPVYDVMRSELMAGQYLDLLEQVQASSSVERAILVARYKSAKYTIERPLHLGAAFAGAPAHIYESYSAYGLPLGEAFQLRDDVLGVFGDPAVIGKPAGDDLREGKRTVLIAIALEHASPAGVDAINTHLGDPDLDEAGVELLRGIISESGALERTEHHINALFEAAVAAIDAADIESEARTVLLGLATAAVKREK